MVEGGSDVCCRLRTGILFRLVLLADVATIHVHAFPLRNSLAGLVGSVYTKK